MYTIPCSDGEYVYMDYFAGVSRWLGFKLKRGQTVQMLYSDLPCVTENGRVFAEGSTGSVCLRVRGKE